MTFSTIVSIEEKVFFRLDSDLDSSRVESGSRFFFEGGSGSAPPGSAPDSSLRATDYRKRKRMKISFID